jgi:hypothetical protein
VSIDKTISMSEYKEVAFKVYVRCARGRRLTAAKRDDDDDDDGEEEEKIRESGR